MPETVQGTVAVDRVREFLRQHGVRLGALALIVAAGAMILYSPPPVGTLWLGLLGPLMIGACIPVASQDSLSLSINGWEQYFDRSLSKAQGREGKFARYFLRPLHAGSLKLWKASQPIPNEHVRAGTRLAAVAYFWAAMLVALVIAAYVIVAIVILMIVLAVIGWYLNRNERSSSGDSYIPARVKGTFYKGASALTQRRAGRVDEQGNVYEGSNVLTEKKVGRVDKDGTVFEGSSMLTERHAGRIDESGKVYKGSSVLTEERVGRVDADGNVLEGSSVLTEEKVGKIEKD